MSKFEKTLADFVSNSLDYIILFGYVVCITISICLIILLPSPTNYIVSGLSTLIIFRCMYIFWKG